MNLADSLRAFTYKNVNSLCPSSNEYLWLKLVIDKLEELNFEIPSHTVIVFPYNYGNEEIPISYTKQRIIMLFPSTNIEQIAYQYLHELCHLLLGSLPQEYKWIGELLSCSCSYFYFPNENDYFSFMCSNVLSLQKNKENYDIIKDKLSQDGYLVYQGDHPIKTLIYSYWLEHKDFDFTAFLKEYIKVCRHGVIPRLNLPIEKLLRDPI